MHEQSETIQDQLGRWMNVFGRNTANAGSPLPGPNGFRSLGQAEGAAQSRSQGAPETLSPLDIQRHWERSYAPPVQQRQGLRALPQPAPMTQMQKLMALLRGVNRNPDSGGRQAILASY